MPRTLASHAGSTAYLRPKALTLIGLRDRSLLSGCLYPGNPRAYLSPADKLVLRSLLALLDVPGVKAGPFRVVSRPDVKYPHCRDGNDPYSTDDEQNGHSGQRCPRVGLLCRDCYGERPSTTGCLLTLP